MRILTLVFAVVLGFIGGSFAQGRGAQAPGPEVVRGRQFILLDSAGHERGEWAVDANGRGVLRMFDSKGNVVFQSGGGPRLLK